MSNDQDIVEYIEWEPLNKPIHISKVHDNENLPNGKKKITIERDEDYNLKSTLEFEDPLFKPKESSKGSIVEGFEIQGSSDHALVSYSLESCFIGDIDIHHNLEEKIVIGKADIGFSMLKIKYGDKKVDHLSDWFVNGPFGHVFSDTTHRKVNRHYIRERFVGKRNKFMTTDKSLDGGSSRTDIIWINADDFQFLVCKVPSGLGPVWSTNIGVEYRVAWGRIPQPDERLKVQELLSFVFGRQLLSIGHTTYDEDENMIETFANNPWGSAAKKVCSCPDYPPINIPMFSGKAEKILVEFLPKYFEFSEPLYLKESLWNYWVSGSMPSGSNLVILAAAIETVIDQWYKWKQTKSHGIYMETKLFASLLKEDIESIEKKLSGNPYSEKMVENILRANTFGIMERYRRFFEEINLAISETEWEAINQRHLFVHGHAHFNEIDWVKVILYTDTLRTLFNRILLKLFGYKGTFIDRSVVGWPEKKMD